VGFFLPFDSSLGVMLRGGFFFKTKYTHMIIGQEHLVNDIDRVFAIFRKSNCQIKPHFFLAGPSGSGKTFIINTLAAAHKLRVLEVNAASITKEGTSGNSVSKALSPLMQFAGEPTIVFVDEFDKLFISGNTNSELAHESTNGVQNEFLKLLEGKKASVFGDYGKYVDVPVDKVLFIFAGAFNGQANLNLRVLKSFGIKNEFLGRVSLLYQAYKLTLTELYDILDSSTLLDNYLKLMKMDKDNVVPILKEFITLTYDTNTIGARQIDSLIHRYFIRGGRLSLEDIEPTVEEPAGEVSFDI